MYSADATRDAAKLQADQTRRAADMAAKQAAEGTRANALAAQTAADRERAMAEAKANADLAAQTVAPEVQVATQAPVEAQRRRTVRATFNPDDAPDSAGVSIRL